MSISITFCSLSMKQGWGGGGGGGRGTPKKMQKNAGFLTPPSPLKKRMHSSFVVFPRLLLYRYCVRVDKVMNTRGIHAKR